MARRADPLEYARSVAQVTQQYLSELKVENESLREFTALLRDERGRLETELERQRTTRNELAQRLLGIEDQHQRLTQQYVQVERHTTELSHLYVASSRLYDRPERSEVLLAIEEIVIGIIGSEQFGIFEVDSASKGLTLVGSMGIDTVAYARLRKGEGAIGETIERGQVYVQKAGAAPSAPPMTACIPLLMGEVAIGAVAIFALLPQKPALVESDLQLFELLSHQGALALYFSGLHELRKAQSAR